MPKHYWIPGVALLFVAAALTFILYEPGENVPGSAREESLKLMRTQLSLTEQQALIWAPFLNASTFPIGTAFNGSGFLQAYTLDCTGVATRSADLGVTIGSGRRYALDSDTEVAVAGKIDLKGAKSVEHRVTMRKAELAPAERELKAQLLGNPACLAAIAGRSVTLLHGVYSGEETYTVTRDFSSQLSLSQIAEQVMGKLGLSTTGGRDDRFERTNGPLIWALTQIDVPLPEGDLPATATIAQRRMWADERLSQV